MRFEIFSDGGSESNDCAAGAAIVRTESQEHRCVIVLGRATNNEAEIAGALLGFCVLGTLAAGEGLSASALQVDWFSDSQYTLKSATEYIHNWQRNGWRTASKEPVKNQGLWRLWLELSAGLRVKAHHVRGHSGHVENELCDGACTWAISQGRDIVEAGDDRSYDLDDLGTWMVFDGRSVIDRARLELGVGTALQALRSEVSTVLGRHKGAVSSAVPRRTRRIDSLLEELRNVESRARQIRGDADAERLAKGLAMLLKKLQTPVE